MDCAAVVVCNVDNTRCPVSAALMAAAKLIVVAHFTEHDDVRILPQHVFQRVVKRQRVQPDLALLDDATGCPRTQIQSGLRA